MNLVHKNSLYGPTLEKQTSFIITEICLDML